MPGRNKRLMKCNYNGKKLVNLGLTACNCYPYHIEFNKEKMGDVTGSQIQVSTRLLVTTISTIAKRKEEAEGIVY